MTRLALLAAAAALVFPAAAHSQSANRKAEAEARSFLSPCHQTTNHKQAVCEENQSNFVEQYVYAKAGDLTSMRGTMDDFEAPLTSANLGFPHNQVQACAWALVVLDLSQGTPNATMDTDGTRRACGRLSDRRYTAAQQRADQLAQQLQTAPAKLPKWTPKPGLDSTAVPLTAN